MDTFDYSCLAIALAAVISAVCVVLYNHYRTKRTLELSSKMIDDAISGGFSEYVFDESLLSSVESKLAQYLSACSVSSKNLSEEKDKIKELIADISHQTKTPIANILLYSQLLGELSLPENVAQQVAALSEQAKKLSFLIDSLVKVSRLETGIVKLAPKPSDVQSLLDAVDTQTTLKAAAKNIAIKIKPTTEKAVFDFKWTAEAVYNIVDNAVKYTSCGGSLDIEVTAYELFCKIDVKDNGIGISEEEQAKIFTRFYRGTQVADAEGVGIGLYLAREIISGEGGYIKVSSELNQGSVFSIYLPRED